MKKEIRKILLSLILLGSTLTAETSFSNDTISLVGIEGGYSKLDYQKNNQAIENVSLGSIGLKVGAESKDYRVFLSGRYFKDSSAVYEYVTTFGGEIQYKFNPSKAFNVFIGLNGGYAAMRFDVGDGFGPRSLSSPYFGGDLGANIHLGKLIDLELGARVISIQATHTTFNNADYTVGNIVNMYASLIFKWQMD